MNPERLKAAGIDYDHGVRRYMGRAQLYEKTLRKFVQDGTFARIQAAYAAEDAAGLLTAAHECKGMCGNIALTALYERSDALVRLLRGGAYTQAELAAAYAQLEAAYQAAHGALLAAMEEDV